MNGFGGVGGPKAGGGVSRLGASGGVPSSAAPRAGVSIKLDVWDDAVQMDAKIADRLSESSDGVLLMVSYAKSSQPRYANFLRVQEDGTIRVDSGLPGLGDYTVSFSRCRIAKDSLERLSNLPAKAAMDVCSRADFDLGDILREVRTEDGDFACFTIPDGTQLTKGDPLFVHTVRMKTSDIGNQAGIKYSGENEYVLGRYLGSSRDGVPIVEVSGLGFYDVPYGDLRLVSGVSVPSELPLPAPNVSMLASMELTSPPVSISAARPLSVGERVQFLFEAASSKYLIGTVEEAYFLPLAYVVRVDGEPEPYCIGWVSSDGWYSTPATSENLQHAKRAYDSGQRPDPEAQHDAFCEFFESNSGTGDFEELIAQFSQRIISEFRVDDSAGSLGSRLTERDRLQIEASAERQLDQWGPFLKYVQFTEQDWQDGRLFRAEGSSSEPKQVMLKVGSRVVRAIFTGVGEESGLCSCRVPFGSHGVTDLQLPQESLRFFFNDDAIHLELRLRYFISKDRDIVATDADWSVGQPVPTDTPLADLKNRLGLFKHRDTIILVRFVQSFEHEGWACEVLTGSISGAQVQVTEFGDCRLCPDDWDPRLVRHFGSVTSRHAESVATEADWDAGQPIASGAVASDIHNKFGMLKHGPSIVWVQLDKDAAGEGRCLYSILTRDGALKRLYWKALPHAQFRLSSPPDWFQVAGGGASVQAGGGDDFVPLELPVPGVNEGPVGFPVQAGGGEVSVERSDDDLMQRIFDGAISLEGTGSGIGEVSSGVPAQAGGGEDVSNDVKVPRRVGYEEHIPLELGMEVEFVNVNALGVRKTGVVESVRRLTDDSVYKVRVGDDTTYVEWDHNRWQTVHQVLPNTEQLRSVEPDPRGGGAGTGFSSPPGGAPVQAGGGDEVSVAMPVAAPDLKAPRRVGYQEKAPLEVGMEVEFVDDTDFGIQKTAVVEDVLQFTDSPVYVVRVDGATTYIEWNRNQWRTDDQVAQNTVQLLSVLQSSSADSVEPDPRGGGAGTGVSDAPSGAPVQAAGGPSGVSRVPQPDAANGLAEVVPGVYISRHSELPQDLDSYDIVVCKGVSIDDPTGAYAGSGATLVNADVLKPNKRGASTYDGFRSAVKKITTDQAADNPTLQPIFAGLSEVIYGSGRVLIVDPKGQFSVMAALQLACLREQYGLVAEGSVHTAVGTLKTTLRGLTARNRGRVARMLKKFRSRP